MDKPNHKERYISNTKFNSIVQNPGSFISNKINIIINLIFLGGGPFWNYFDGEVHKNLMPVVRAHLWRVVKLSGPTSGGW